MLNPNKERKNIDVIDSKIVGLISQRLKIAKKIGKYKKSKGLKIPDRKREREVIRHVRNKAKGENIDGKFIGSLFRDIIRYTRSKQK